MSRKQPLKPGEKILFSVFIAFFTLAAVGYIILESVRAQRDEPMFTSRSSFDLSAEGKRGSEIFRKSGCTACHRAMRSGTNSGLSLDGIGSQHDAAWIENFLLNPEAVYPSKTVDHGFGPGKEAGYVQSMPRERLHAIAVFLSQLKAEPGSSMAKEPPPESSGFIDAMVNMWAPEGWKHKYRDIRDTMKREPGAEQPGPEQQEATQPHE